MATYRTYFLREDNKEADITETTNPRIAAVIFRGLVSRGDLRRQHPIAVLERDGKELASINIANKNAAKMINLDVKEFPGASPQKILRAIMFIGDWKDGELVEAVNSYGYSLSKSRLKAFLSEPSLLTWEELEIIADALCEKLKNE